jgi:hypothetical protein
MFRTGQFVVSRRREDEWTAYLAEAFTILGPLSDAVPRHGRAYRIRAIKDSITGGGYLSLEGLPETVIYHSGWFRLARRPIRATARSLADRALAIFYRLRVPR